MNNFTKLKEATKQAAIDLSESLPPGGDWLPITVIGRRDGSFAAKELPTEMFQDSESKDILWRNLLPDLIRDQHAEQIAVVTSVWMIEVTLGDLPPGKLQMPSESPNRREALCITVVDREHAEIWVAEVNRHEHSPPELGEWKVSRNEAIMSKSVAAIMDALR